MKLLSHYQSNRLFPLFFTLFLTFSSTINATLSTIQLNQLASHSPNNVIYLNLENFYSIVTGPREYYTSVLFTALDERTNCQQCVKFDANYQRVAASYLSSNPDKNAVYFFIVDFQPNKQIYADLNIKQVPRLWVFPPSKDPNYNITSPHYPYSIGEAAVTDILDFANFISKIVGINIVINAEFDLNQFLSYFFMTFFGVLILKKKIVSKMNKRSISSHLSVLIIVVLISGYMFTVIRGIPLIAKNEEGEIMYFSGGTHWQFGLETFAISAIYIVLTALIAALVVYIPKIEDEQKKSALVILASFGIFYVFNYLTQIFLIKDPGYPYRLTNFF